MRECEEEGNAVCGEQSQATFREGALGLLAAVCNDSRDHRVMCRKGLARDLCEETARVSSPLISTCVAVIAAIAVTPDARDYLREAGCIRALVQLLCSSTTAQAQKDLALRTLATLSTNNVAVATELVRSGAVPVLTAVVRGAFAAVQQHIADAVASGGGAAEAAAAAAASGDDTLLTNSLWTVATASCSKEGHAQMLSEGLVELLVRVLDSAPKQTYCDYALSALLQLTATEECRRLMVRCRAHEILTRLVAAASTPSTAAT